MHTSIHTCHTMTLLENSSPALSKKPSQIWDHMPRRRKRHIFNNRMMLMLMLLIFFNCYSTLILCSTDVQAKHSNPTALIGTDRHSNQHLGTSNVLAKYEDNVSKDATNERIHINNAENKYDDDDDDDDDDDGNGLSSEVIEMIEPSHTLRHQEHNKQQQQQQQQQQQKQQQGNHYSLKQKPKEQHEYQHEQQKIYGNTDDVDNDDNDDEEDDEIADDINDDNEHIRRLRYQQIQAALREPITPPTPHHRRHEHHLESKQLTKQTEFKWPHHHLRHQHHQRLEFNNNRQSQLRHLNHEIRKQNLTNHLSQTILAKSPHQRYFDRETSYSNPFITMATTEGPRLRHYGSNKNWKSITTYEYLNSPYNRLLNDAADTNSNQMEDVKRFSLSLDANENENMRKSTNKNVLLSSTIEDVADYDGNEYVNDNAADEDIDDYSYEDDNKEELNSRSKYPSIATTNAKANVKRYTNPLRPLYKPPLRNQHMRAGYEIKQTEDDDYDDIVDNHEEYNKSSSSISPLSSSSNISDESLNDNDDDKFSDEKWNKIEHEHYRKQLQHQRAMQALRSRRPINENSLPPHRYSSHPTSTYNSNGWTKRQTVNNDNEDNIYSRYYVPGTMTRKKEEELGSPTTIIESRRQYAMQQRQNKALASAHHRRIVTEGSCRLPQPRIERIRRDSWKIYTPHCTILHRCTDDAGCCPSERQTCAPKRTKNVDLYFFVISLNETQGSIEKLTFINHTECHCVDRSKQRAPEYGNSRSKELITNNQIPFLRRATILNCYCPNLFEKILQEDGYCRCDCSSGNMGCDWLKRGMEHFSMNDRKCIIEGRCKLPTCEYGQYIKKHGRCPRREERHLSADVDW